MVSAALLLLGALARPPQVDEVILAPLRGIDRVEITIENLDDMAAICGITTDLLETATSRPLLDGGIKVAPGALVTVYVNANVAATPDGLCVAATRVQAVVYMSVALPYAPKSVVVKVEVWQSGNLLNGSRADMAPRANHGGRLRDKG